MNKIKIYYILLSIIAILLSGCKSSTEDLIYDELREYVRNNFDDPKSFKELVSIEPIDTIYSEKYKELLVTSLQGANAVDSLCDAIFYTLIHDKELPAKCRRARDGIYEDEIKNLSMYMQGIIDFFEICQGRMDLYKKNIVEYIADSNSLPKIDILVYKIKYRSKNGDSLALNEMYATVDRTKNENNIIIRSNELQTSELPERILKVLKDMESFMELVKKKQGLYIEAAKSYYKLKKIFP